MALASAGGGGASAAASPFAAAGAGLSGCGLSGSGLASAGFAGAVPAAAAGGPPTDRGLTGGAGGAGGAATAAGTAGGGVCIRGGASESKSSTASNADAPIVWSNAGPADTTSEIVGSSSLATVPALQSGGGLTI